MSAYKVISAEEFGRRFNDGQIHVIDVRNPPEFAGGHVEGALLCPLGELNPPKIIRPDEMASGALRTLLVRWVVAVQVFAVIVWSPHFVIDV